MNNLLKITMLSASLFTYSQIEAQESPASIASHGNGQNGLLHGNAYNDGVTTIDSLSIDAEINLVGGVFMQRGATGDIGTLTLMELDASEVDISKMVQIDGATHLGEDARISEGNLHLSGDMGSVNVTQKYTRTGMVQISHGAKLNMGNIMVPR